MPSASASGHRALLEPPSTFLIDPNQSYIVLSGTAGNTTNIPIEEQFSGSLRTSLSGSIIADTTDLSSIAFFPQSSIQPALQPALALPGNVPAQFAGRADNFITIWSVSYGAFQNIIMTTPTSATTATGGVLDTSKIKIAFNSGIAKMLLGTSVAGTLPITVNPTNSVASGSLAAIGSQTTMTIPFMLDGVVEQGQVFAATVHFSGQIVAVAAVPEPSTLTLGAFGVIALLTFRRRR